jgi:hypothetical protein
VTSEVTFEVGGTLGQRFFSALLRSSLKSLL